MKTLEDLLSEDEKKRISSSTQKSPSTKTDLVLLGSEDSLPAEPTEAYRFGGGYLLPSDTNDLLTEEEKLLLMQGYSESLPGEPLDETDELPPPFDEPEKLSSVKKKLFEELQFTIADLEAVVRDFMRLELEAVVQGGVDSMLEFLVDDCDLSEKELLQEIHTSYFSREVLEDY